MSVKLSIRFKPLYEMVTSLLLLMAPHHYKKSDAGERWARNLRKSLPPSFMGKLKDKPNYEALLYLRDILIMLDHLPLATAAQIREWFGQVSAGRLLDKDLLPAAMQVKVPPVISRLDPVCALLAEWERVYFENLDPAICRGLARDAAEKREAAKTMPPIDLLEWATGGARLMDAEGLRMIILVPQYHARPLNLYDFYDDIFINHYPVDALPPPEGEPPTALLRLTSALADPTRLKILRFLARGEAGFGEIARHIKAAKSTVHYHLIALRAAGLVRVHFKGKEYVRYSLRRRALAEIGNFLAAYFDPPTGNGPGTR